MRIEHLAIWVKDLERMKTFYAEYFGAIAGEKYHNPKKGFKSYFVSFEGGARLELMNRIDIDAPSNDKALGYAHLAISLGSKEKVDLLTERMRSDGYTVFGEARTTGDGYYESVVLDPEGNQIELTV